MKKILAILIIFITAFTWGSGTKVKAQDTPSDWTIPVNISKSGSASNPSLIVDSLGQPLVLWKDEFSGYFYSFLSNGSWSEPKAILMPFPGTESPTILQYLSGGSGITHLFWLDNQRRLNYSKLTLKSVEDTIFWQRALIVSNNLDSFRADIDEDGNIHIAYLVGRDTANLSAGIYYLRITSGGAIISPAVMDQSPYYRTAGQGGLENQNGALASYTVWSTGKGPDSTVILSWNNPSTKRLYLRKSTTAGKDWGKVNEIVTPDESTVNQVPQMPTFAEIGKSILMLWQYNQEGVLCKQYYQVSDDLGETWEERQELLPDLYGCPEVNQIYSEDDQKNLLVSILNNQIYLTVINNFQPSSPQLQGELSSFSDPATYGIVQLRSQQLRLIGDRLYFWGTGAGEFRDTWVSYRLFDTLFKSTDQMDTWTSPKVIVQQHNPFRDLVLLGNESNIVHAFWSMPDGEKKPGMAIVYASWDEPESIQPRNILRSPEGKTDQPSAAVDGEGRVYVVWSGGTAGELYLSYSDIAQARSEIDWSAPAVIFSGSSAATNPVLKIGIDGTLYVAYLVPLNEERGVYVISSQNRGETWSVPIRVYDGASQKCDMVVHLSYSITNEDTQHLAWMCSAIPGGTGAYTLNYANSFDFGQTWIMTRESKEMQVIWGEVAGLRREDLHLVWLEETEGSFQVWDQVSMDDGQTWQIAKVIETYEDEFGPSSLAVDPGGQLFLAITEQEVGKITLHSWSWNGNAWTSFDDSTLATGRISLLNSMAAAVLSRGELGVIYSLENPTTSTELLYHSLLYMSHPVTLKPAFPKLTPVSLRPTLETAATPVPDVSTSQLVEITAVPQPTVDSQAWKEESAPMMNNIFIYAIGAILAMGVVVFAFVLRQNKH